MRERFLIGLVIGCLAGALCAPLFAQSWQRLYATTSTGTAIPVAASSSGALKIVW